MLRRIKHLERILQVHLYIVLTSVTSSKGGPKEPSGSPSGANSMAVPPRRSPYSRYPVLVAPGEHPPLITLGGKQVCGGWDGLSHPTSLYGYRSMQMTTNTLNWVQKGTGNQCNFHKLGSMRAFIRNRLQLDDKQQLLFCWMTQTILHSQTLQAETYGKESLLHCCHCVGRLYQNQSKQFTAVHLMC